MIKKLFLYTSFISTVALQSCTQEADVNGTGTLSLRVTDAPTDAANVAGVFITFDKVEYKHDGKWHEFKAFQGPKTINLLELTEGKTELLGDFIVGAGEYSDLRFHLDASANGGSVTNQKTYIEFTDGSLQPLYVPSGTQSGYKSKGSFVVPVNGTVFVTADFDVRKSVVKSGNSGKWILKPVIRLVVNDQAGTITGSLANIKENERYLVYTYTNDSYTEAEAAVPAEGQLQFPNAISSTLVQANGDFTLSFLAPGTYDLVVASQDAEGNFTGVIGVMQDVEVTSLETTRISISF